MKQRNGSITASPTKIQVRNSEVHGRGVFALRPIRESELIGHYTGRRYTVEEIASRTWNPRMTYVFGLSDGSLIDAGEQGNDTRFINHACEPNCIAYEVDDGAGPAIEIRAMRAIDAGDELSLDYALDIAENDPSQYACRCASPKCRGSMLAHLED